MLASAKIVGFIPTKDYDKARSFYEGKLGFEFESLDKFALVMNVSGHMIRITKVPNFTPLQGTILGWQVENIESVAAWLKDRGVPPEKYPFRTKTSASGPLPTAARSPGSKTPTATSFPSASMSPDESAFGVGALAPT